MKLSDYPLHPRCDEACFFHCTLNYRHEPECLLGRKVKTVICGKEVIRELVHVNGVLGVKTAYDFLPWSVLKVDSILLPWDSK